METVKELRVEFGREIIPKLLQTGLEKLVVWEGAWGLIGRFVAFRPKGCGFQSRSSRRVGTLGKSLTHSCLWRFGAKQRHSSRAVSGVPLSSSNELEEAL